MENLINVCLQMIELLICHLLDFCFLISLQVTVQNSHQWLNKVSVACCNDFFAIYSQEFQTWLNEFVEKCLEACHEFGSLFHLLWQHFGPGFNQWENTNGLWLHINHAASGYGSWRGYGQIFDFEHHGHLRGQGKNLTWVETKFLVIIEHSVHGLDPKRVNWAIENDPVFFNWLISDTLPDHVGENTISPLMGLIIELTIKLTHLDWFGIQDVIMNLGLSFVSQCGHCTR